MRAVPMGHVHWKVSRIQKGAHSQKVVNTDNKYPTVNSRIEQIR